MGEEVEGIGLGGIGVEESGVGGVRISSHKKAQKTDAPKDAHETK